MRAFKNGGVKGEPLLTRSASDDQSVVVFGLPLAQTPRAHSLGRRSEIVGTSSSEHVSKPFLPPAEHLGSNIRQTLGRSVGRCQPSCPKLSPRTDLELRHASPAPNLANFAKEHIWPALFKPARFCRHRPNFVELGRPTLPPWRSASCPRPVRRRGLTEHATVISQRSGSGAYATTLQFPVVLLGGMSVNVLTEWRVGDAKVLNSGRSLLRRPATGGRARPCGPAGGARMCACGRVGGGQPSASLHNDLPPGLIDLEAFDTPWHLHIVPS